jgi:hypothetical protein
MHLESGFVGGIVLPRHIDAIVGNDHHVSPRRAVGPAEGKDPFGAEGVGGVTPGCNEEEKETAELGRQS